MPLQVVWPDRGRLAADVGASGWIGIRGLEGVPGAVYVRFGQAPDGRLICTGLLVGIGEKEQRELTARGLRNIRLGEIVGELYRMSLQAPAVKRGPGGYEIGFDSFEELAGHIARLATRPYSGPVARPGPKGHPREHFARVAEAYRAALVTHPRAPMKALTSQVHASEATVHRWVQRARDMGLLRESIPGKAGEQAAPKRQRSQRKGKR